MKKTIFAMLCWAAFFVSCNVSFAQDLDKKFGLGLRLAYMNLSDDQIGTTNLTYREGILFEGVLTYYFNKSFSLEFIGGYNNTTINREFTYLGTRYGVEMGELRQIPVLLNAHYTFWPLSELAIYVGGGVGYYLNDITLSDAAKIVLPNFDVEIDNSLGFQVNVGVDFFLNDKIAMNWDVRYAWNKADYVEKDAGSPDTVAELDLNAFVFGIGFKYYF